jgi:hypothetical protein
LFPFFNADFDGAVSIIVSPVGCKLNKILIIHFEASDKMKAGGGLLFAPD